MLLAVNRLDVPLGDVGWEKHVSGKLGRSAEQASREGLTATFLKSWTWARKAEKAALARAERLRSEGHIEGSEVLERALTLAKRHSGVWRAANKMHRDNGAGRMIRTACAVRPDAGDTSCPSFLERQAHNRCKEMRPLVLACSKVGYKICRAVLTGVPRLEAASIIRELCTDTDTLPGVHGLDILTVPSIIEGPMPSRRVDIHVIAAMDVERDYYLKSTDLTVRFLPGMLNWEASHEAMFNACLAYGPSEWINLHIDMALPGLKLRSRITKGCFYGAAAEKLVKRAAELDCESMPALLNLEVGKVSADIQAALAIAVDAAEQGDLQSAQRACQYATCYAEDIASDLETEYPVVKLALSLLARFDLTGLVDTPVLPSIREALQSRIDSLRLPKERKLPEVWQCVEHVKIKTVEDIKALVAWIKEGKDN